MLCRALRMHFETERKLVYPERALSKQRTFYIENDYSKSEIDLVESVIFGLENTASWTYLFF